MLLDSQLWVLKACSYILSWNCCGFGVRARARARVCVCVCVSLFPYFLYFVVVYMQPDDVGGWVLMWIERLPAPFVVAVLGGVCFISGSCTVLPNVFSVQPT